MLYYRYVLLLTIVVLFTVPLFFNDVLADEAPPGIDFSGMNLVINAELKPPYLTANESDRKSLSIRIFDTNTNQNLEKVTIRVEIWQDDELLARNLFYDIDGILNVEIKPEKNCVQSTLDQNMLVLLERYILKMKEALSLLVQYLSSLDCTKSK